MKILNSIAFPSLINELLQLFCKNSYMIYKTITFENLCFQTKTL